MTNSEFSHLLSSINSLSPEQMRQLRHEFDDRLAPAAENSQDATGEQRANLELQRQLLDAGIISELRPPITDWEPYRNRKAVPIQGEPISETIIRERR